MRPQGFRTGSFAQFVPDDVSGTLDCEHMAPVGNGTPCLAVDAPASFDPYEPGGIKTVREDGAANTVINGTCPGNHGAVVQRVTNSNGGDVAPTLFVTDLVKQFTGQADNGGGYVCATVEKPTPAVCIAENTIGRGERTGGNGVGAQEGVAYTLDTVAPHAVAYGMNPQASLMHPCTEGVVQTLAVSHEGGVVQPRRSTCLTPGDPIQKRVYTADGPAPTLQSIAEGSGVSAQAFVLPQDADGLPEVVVRRLTPTECERLMGLPDGWTRVTFTPDQIADPAIVAYFRRVHDDWQKMIAEDGKTPKPKTEAFVRDWLAKISDPATCPDAPRFKVCGNGMCANQVRWILLNLLHSEKINPWYGEDNQ